MSEKANSVGIPTELLWQIQGLAYKLTAINIETLFSF